MISLNAQAETVFFALCYSCSNELHEHDKFCRRCGASQSAHAEQLLQYRTSAMTSGELYHTISSPLVKAVTAEMSTVTTTPFNNTFIRPVILALISIPIWLMIILLSPLDAYAAARSATGRVRFMTK